MKVRYIGPTDELTYINGKIYEVDHIFADHFVVEDEVGDFGLCTKDSFEIVEGVEEELDVYKQDPKTFEDILVRKGKRKTTK